MEVKNTALGKPSRDKARLQLFTYLNSGPKNSNPLLSDIKYGLVLLWPVQNEKQVLNQEGDKANLSSPVVNPEMELWKTRDSDGTKLTFLSPGSETTHEYLPSPFAGNSKYGLIRPSEYDPHFENLKNNQRIRE